MEANNDLSLKMKVSVAQNASWYNFDILDFQPLEVKEKGTCTKYHLSFRISIILSKKLFIYKRSFNYDFFQIITEIMMRFSNI